jgi:hypothetical protein
MKRSSFGPQLDPEIGMTRDGVFPGFQSATTVLETVVFFHCVTVEHLSVYTAEYCVEQL